MALEEKEPELGLEGEKGVDEQKIERHDLVYGEIVEEKEAAIPPGILKPSSSYDTALNQVDDQEPEGKKSKSRKKGKKKDGEQSMQSTKVVPVWYLFRFAKPIDIFMIIVGALMSIAAGTALPGHMLLFGEVIDNFIAYDVATILRNENNLTGSQARMIATGGGMGSGGGTMISLSFGGGDNSTYFCDFAEDQEESNIFKYITADDTGDALQAEIGIYSYYYLAMATALLIASFLSIALWNLAAYRQTLRMRLVFFNSILRQDIAWFDVNPSSQLNTRLSDDIEKIQAGIGEKAGIFLQYFTTFISGFIIAFASNWKLTLVVGTMLPVLAFLAAVIAKIVASFTVREQNAYALAGGVAEEVLSSIRTVVAFGGESKETERYENYLSRAKRIGFKKGFLTSIVTGLLYFVIFSTYALGFWYGATLIADCELRPGQVVTVFFGVVIGSFSLGNALPELQTFATALGSATVVFAIIDRQPEIDATSNEGLIPDSLEGRIEFKDVIFNYPARPNTKVLQGLDLSVHVGQTVALVGPSGCGKSTVIHLLQRFYNIIGGQITVDGHDIKDLNLRWLRGNIGVVSQEPVLFDTTIIENIQYGKENTTMAEIEAAAKAANAYNFISELPEGFKTIVGEKGTQLSGGQKQRIAIARALVRDPKILLLDEATSALDTESEKVVQDALDKAREGRTTIVIAHRLSTIQTADVIAGIEGGRVVEMGTHAELMKNQGLYFELVTAQTIVEQDEKRRDSLSSFKVALRRSSSRHSYKREHSTSSQEGLPYFQRQSSTQSSGDVFTALTDHLSRYSLEDIPVAAHPSPSPARTFGSPEEISPNVFKSVEPKPEEPEHLVVTGGTRTLIVQPSSPDKAVRFDINEDSVKIKDKPHKGSWFRKAKTAESDADPLVEVTFTELLKLNIPDWYLVILGVFCSTVLGALFPLMAILFSGLLELFGSVDRDTLLDGAAEYAGYFIILAVGAFIFQFTAIITLSFAGERLTQRLRINTFQAMMRQEMSWYDKRSNSTGALTTRLAVDASEVKGATGLRLGTVLQTISGVITALIIAFEAAWLLTIVLFACFPLLVGVGYLQIRLLKGRSVRNKELTAESGKTANEAIDNIRTVASLGVETKFYDLYNEQLKPPFKSNMKSVFTQATIFALAQSSIFYIYAAGFSVGAFQVISDSSSVYHADYEEIFRVFAAVVFTALSVGRASSFAPDAQKAQLSASRIMTLLNRKPEIDGYDENGMKLEKPTGAVSLNNVHFNYPARPNVPVLQGLSISVQPGETLALVGPSGCGKSTVVSLTERFYDPSVGSLQLDGEDLRDLNIRWLRHQIGIVSQEPVLFDSSIADNIRYGANFRDVSDEEVIEAAKAANIHNFIQTLPEGYSTNVGSKGTQLSGGQKQRVAIARALVRDPKILLLDEATSALDTESEKIVQEALDRAREGRTSIVIAHRLSTIYNSDCIAVIHDGAVIEKGTHSQLMAQGGAYYLLNTVQKKEKEEDE